MLPPFWAVDREFLYIYTFGPLCVDLCAGVAHSSKDHQGPPRDPDNPPERLRGTTRGSRGSPGCPKRPQEGPAFQIARYLRGFRHVAFTIARYLRGSRSPLSTKYRNKLNKKSRSGIHPRIPRIAGIPRIPGKWCQEVQFRPSLPRAGVSG